MIKDRIAILEYHRHDPYENPDSRGRIDYYGLLAYPTAKFDGKVEILGGWYGMANSYLEIYDSLMQYHLSPCSLNVCVDYDFETRFLKVKSVIGATDSIQNAHLHYVIAESHIPRKWWSLDSLHHVVRKMLPDYRGVALPPLIDDDIWADSQTCQIDSLWNHRNCYLVVFVQEDDAEKPVLRSARYGPLAWVFGDANGDGNTDIADLVRLANYLFKNGRVPDVLRRADSNNDCTVDVADIVYLTDYLFRSGPAPLKGCAQ